MVNSMKEVLNDLPKSLEKLMLGFQKLGRKQHIPDNEALTSNFNTSTIIGDQSPKYIPHPLPLETLNQEGDVEEYITKFKALSAINPDRTEKQSLGLFIGGLQVGIKDWVRVLRPTTCERAMDLARHVATATPAPRERSNVKSKSSNFAAEASRSDLNWCYGPRGPSHQLIGPNSQITQQAPFNTIFGSLKPYEPAKFSVVPNCNIISRLTNQGGEARCWESCGFGGGQQFTGRALRILVLAEINSRVVLSCSQKQSRQKKIVIDDTGEPPTLKSPREALSIMKIYSSVEINFHKNLIDQPSWFFLTLFSSLIYQSPEVNNQKREDFSAYGWINVDMDIIACDLCVAYLFFSTPSSCAHQQVELAASGFSLKLNYGHKSLCTWVDNACGEKLAQFPPTSLVNLIYSCKKRCGTLLQPLKLHVISRTTINYFWSSLMEHFLKSPQSLANEREEVSPVLYYQAQKLTPTDKSEYKFLVKGKSASANRKVTNKILKEEEGYELRDKEHEHVQVMWVDKLQGHTAIFIRKGHDNIEPLKFKANEEQEIDGLGEVVVTMKKGEVALLTNAPENPFGYIGSKQELTEVPPNATIIYEIKLVSFVKDKEYWDMNTTQKKIEVAGKKKRKVEDYHAILKLFIYYTLKCTKWRLMKEVVWIKCNERLENHLVDNKDKQTMQWLIPW